MDSKFGYFILINNIHFLIIPNSILIQSIVACLCFWTEKASSIERLLFIPTLFLSGLLAPVVSFPDYVKRIYLTPFPYLIDFPANLLSGNATNVGGGLSMQIYGLFYFSHYLKICPQAQRNILLWAHEPRKIFKVYTKFIHTSLACELEYKTNILIDLITALISLIEVFFYYLFSFKMLAVLEAGA